jgi:hypothetical protein
MNTHPDVLWELVKDHQSRLLDEAEHLHQARLAAAGVRAEGTHRSAREWRWFGRPAHRGSAGTLTACGPGVVG